MPSVAEQKRVLRAQLSTRLDQLPPEAARAAAQDIARRVLDLPEIQAARHVLTCLSFGTEVDTWVLVDQLLESGRSIYVPRADAHDHQIHVHRYPCPLRTLSFGLRQPPRGTPEVPADDLQDQLDIALVLGLAFDRQGYRLGHGAGYFDRFLAAHPVPAVGLAFDLQLVDTLPVEAHDLPMNIVVSESGVWRPS